MQELINKLDYVYITKESELESVVEDLTSYRLFFPNKRMKIGFDEETYFSDPYYKEQSDIMYGKDKGVPQSIRTGPGEDDWEGLVRLFSVGLDPNISNKQYLLDVLKLGDGSNSAGRRLITKHFKQMFEKDAILIGQNLQYDLGFLALQFNIFPEQIRDCMLIGQLRWTGDKLLYDNSEASFSLSALYGRCIPEVIFISLTGKTASEYEEYKKVNQKSDWSGLLDDNQLQYAADDVRLIFFVYDSLLKECNEFIKKNKKSGLLEQIRIECGFALECALMSCIGVGFDTDYHKNELIPFLTKYADEALDRLTKIPEMWVIIRGTKIEAPKKGPYMKWSYEFADPARGKLLGRALVENLGLELPLTEKETSYSVKDEVLNELFWEMEESKAKDILELVIQCRTAQSYLDKNGEGYFKWIHDDGRIHASIFQRGSEDGAIDTGRMSIKKPALQTIPNDPVEVFEGCKKTASEAFRKSYVAKLGIIDKKPHKLLDADFSNQEVRVITVYSKDKQLIRIFKNKEDLHQNTADNLGVSRPNGKLFFLSSQYGAYPRKIRRNLYNESRGKFKASLDEVTTLREKHFQFYSGLSAHIKECADYVEKIMSPHDTLCDFINRKPILIGFTPTFGAHRLWCLSKDDEYEAYRLIRDGKKGNPYTDTLHKDHKVLNKNTGKMSVFKNKYNKRKGEIIRELFNMYVQGDCAVVIKKSATNIGNRFRNEMGWSPHDAQIIIPAHDELLADVREDLVEPASKIMVEEMHKAQTLITKDIIPCQIKINFGTNWFSAAPK